MKKILIVIIFSLFVSANEKTDIDKWLTYYYLQPEPNKFEIVVKELSSIGFLERKKSLAPMGGFFSVIFRGNKNKVDKWIDFLVNLKENERKIFIMALYYSDIKDKYEHIKKLVKTEKEKKLLFGIKKLKFINLIDMDVISAKTLDIHWGAFMASGDERHIYKIIDSLSFGGIKGKKPTNILIIEETAKWSLSSNAKQHKKVLDICKYFIDNPQYTTDDVNQILKNIVKKVEKNHN
ncbi:hypothetical protein [Arcobacter sp. LA11]|uniref:hypothetical protein n=1 Tax=Arcobacter sp. LA11 TaxID=1898176 RepID=UPI000934867F|nr:hypothetical protein [Arcobacter sp. LA11]